MKIKGRGGGEGGGGEGFWGKSFDFFSYGDNQFYGIIGWILMNILFPQFSACIETIESHKLDCKNGEQCYSCNIDTSIFQKWDEVFIFFS